MPSLLYSYGPRWATGLFLLAWHTGLLVYPDVPNCNPGLTYRSNIVLQKVGKVLERIPVHTLWCIGACNVYLQTSSYSVWIIFVCLKKNWLKNKLKEKCNKPAGLPYVYRKLCSELVLWYKWSIVLKLRTASTVRGCCGQPEQRTYSSPGRLLLHNRAVLWSLLVCACPFSALTEQACRELCKTLFYKQ